MFSAVEALPCGSRSITSTRCPSWASAAATFTVEVVLPTPPFWLATTTTRVLAGRGTRWRPEVSDRRASSMCSAAWASGVVFMSSSLANGAISPEVRTVKPGDVSRGTLRPADPVSRETPGSAEAVSRETAPEAGAGRNCRWRGRPVDNFPHPVESQAWRVPSHRWITLGNRIVHGRGSGLGGAGALTFVVAHEPCFRLGRDFLARARRAGLSAPVAVPDGQDTRAGSARATRSHGGLGEDALAQSPHLRRGAAPRAQVVGRGRDLLLRPRTPSSPAGRRSGATSGIDQPSSRSSGASAREVTTSKRRLAVQRLGAPADDPHVRKPELVDHLLQERRAAQQRLDQGDLQVRAGDRQHQAGQAGAGAEVADRGALRGSTRRARRS